MVLSNKGPVTQQLCFLPPVARIKASTVPSPPSAIGTLYTVSPGNRSSKALSAVSQKFFEVRLPLNESGATTKIIFSSLRAMRKFSLTHNRLPPILFPKKGGILIG